jgi:hypothetical protein
MSQMIKGLAALLVLQAALVVWLYRRGGEMAAFSATEPLLSVPEGSVDGLLIEQKGEPALRLRKQAAGWVLPDSAGFPADAGKAAGLIKKLLELKKSWPVAQTEIAAKQLKVTGEEFERKISFLKGDQVLGALYVGTSPAFRKVHLRPDGEKAIYSAEFSAHEADPKAGGWYDRNLLRVDRTDISAVVLNGLNLRESGSGLQLEGLGPQEEINRNEADKLLAQLSGVTFADMAGVEEKPAYSQAALVLEYAVDTKKTGKISYRVSGPLEGETHYLLKSSQYPYYFKVVKDSFDQLKQITREKLVKAKDAAAAKSEGAPAADPAPQSPLPAAP